ncbi:AAA family ATPase [Agromyces laixinhei]|uniref:AAA family ATPase n=1 Tax=Agromyces laixinhei TaxID=2585717 RepID=UPI0012ED5857|nr:DUF3696 domain-containing protein [Agromyces laixinhei]
MSKEPDEEITRTRLYATAGTAYASRMLTQLAVSNMKALKGDHVVPLAPLTLVFGPNAAGKSSIIQSLHLLAQSVRADTFTPRGPFVDVQDFASVISGHDTSRELRIGIRFLVEEEDSDAVMLASTGDDETELVPSIKFEGGVTLTFGDSQDGRPPAVHADLDLGEASLIEPTDPVPVLEGFDDDTGPYGPFHLRWTVDLADGRASESLAMALERLHPHDREARSAAALLRLASECVSSGYASAARLEYWTEPMDWQPGLHAPSRLTLSIQPASAPPAGRQAIQVGGRGLTPDVETTFHGVLDQWAAGKTESATFDGFGPLVRAFGSVEEEARGLLRSDLLGEDNSPAAHRYRDKREWDHRPETELVRLGPIRPTPSRVHVEGNTSDTAALALIRRLSRGDRLLRSVNEWLEQLEIPYSVEIDRLVSARTGAEFGFSFALTDTRTGVEVNMVDVGYGVSQVLPIIAACAGAQASIICIEQPELHLHPRLAANLAELFVDTANRGNQVIAETHSENILLRVQRMIREGRIVSEDVAVIYVDNRGGAEATVRRLQLDDEGDLIDRWPGGFFDDRLADILGVSS